MKFFIVNKEKFNIIHIKINRYKPTYVDYYFLLCKLTTLDREKKKKNCHF